MQRPEAVFLFEHPQGAEHIDGVEAVFPGNAPPYISGEQYGTGAQESGPEIKKKIEGLSFVAAYSKNDKKEL